MNCGTFCFSETFSAFQELKLFSRPQGVIQESGKMLSNIWILGFRDLLFVQNHFEVFRNLFRNISLGEELWIFICPKPKHLFPGTEVAQNVLEIPETC